MAGEDPRAVRVGPGWLYIAPVGATEPTDLSGELGETGTPNLAAWVPLGYTDEGSTFTFNQTFENVEVEEEYDPVEVLQTAREINISFASAQLTAANLKTAFNGGTITTASGIVTFEPPEAGDYTPVALAWEATDGLERWLFRRCIQVGTVEISRRRAPNKAVIPTQFRATKPHDAKPFRFIHDEDYTPAAS
jgi:hypothetical protein